MERGKEEEWIEREVMIEREDWNEEGERGRGGYRDDRG